LRIESINKNMKKINNLLVAGTIISLIIPVSSVLADTATGTTRIEKINARIDQQEARLEQIKAKIASTTEVRLQKADERAVKIAKKNSEKLTERYTNAIEQLDRTAQKITDLIAKMDTKGLDTTIAKNALANAQLKITAAKNVLATLQTYIDAQTITAKTRVNIMKSVRNKAETSLKSAIKDAHSALVDVINSLKPGRKVSDKAATTTPIATTTTSTTTNQ
jgi:vacuolar-type H+-ATPase subunit I/STV1